MSRPSVASASPSTSAPASPSSAGDTASPAFRNLPWLVLVALGLVCIGIWTDVTGYSAVLVPPGAEDVTSRAYEEGRLLTAILIVIFARFVERNQVAVFALCALLLAVSTNGMVLAYNQSVYDPAALAAASSWLGGMGYFVVAAPFYLLMARHCDARSAACCITASLVGETACSLLISLKLDLIPQILITALSPIAACACYALARHLACAQPACPAEVPSAAPGRAIPAGPHAVPTSRPMFPRLAGSPQSRALLWVRLLLICVAAAYIRSLSSVGVWGRTRDNFIGMDVLAWDELGWTCLLVTAVSLLVFVVPRRLPNQTRTLIGLAIVVAGVQLLAISGDAAFTVSFDVVTTSFELFSHLLVWMNFMECACALDTPAFRIRGVMVIVNTVVTIALDALVTSASLSVNAAVMIFVYALLVGFGCLVIIPAHPMRGQERADGAAPDDRAAPEVLARLLAPEDAQAVHACASSRGLTTREEEVLAMLLAGKTRPEIEDACGLSEGTVRTHLNNLYKKLGVHSRDDVREVVLNPASRP